MYQNIDAGRCSVSRSEAQTFEKLMYTQSEHIVSGYMLSMKDQSN
jgi:hypothetical protein